jgi:hypothetical protein
MDKLYSVGILIVSCVLMAAMLWQFKHPKRGSK